MDTYRLWGEMLRTFRERAGYRQGELADAFSFIHLPPQLVAATDNLGANITLQNYELSRYEQGHRCPRPRQRHLELIYGLVHLHCIASPLEANEWLAAADQRPLNDVERALIFGKQHAQLLTSAPRGVRLEMEISPEQLHVFDGAHRRSYLNRILHQCEYLPLQEITMDSAASTLPTNRRIGLLDVYIDLDTTAKVQEIPGNAGQARRGRGKALSVLQALIDARRLVLLGAPGSGKSTFVNYLAYCLAGQQLNPDEQWLAKHLPLWPDSWRNLLPIHVTLRELAMWIDAEGITQRNSRLLLDYLQNWLHQRILDEFYFVLKDCLRQGQALLLLDGFDELPDNSRLQRQVKEMIADLPDAFPHAPMLVTCRVLSYRTTYWQLDSEIWPVFELAELTDKQITHFIDDWYQLVAIRDSLGGVQRTADTVGQSGQLQRAVMRPDLLRLARNPLLLTVMALVHMHRGQLPDARALLLEAVVELLLWRWEAIKLKDPSGHETSWRQLLASVQINETMMKERLWKLAFHIHGRTHSGEQERTADIAESDLLATLRDLHPQRSMEWAERLVQIMQVRAGLLIEKRPKLFGFPHRTFQEYLAACHLSTQQEFIGQALLLAEQHQSWHEVILLAVGYLAHCNNAIERPLLLIGELCPTTTGSAVPLSPTGVVPGSSAELPWRKLWLAGKALLEIGLVRAQSLQQGRALVERLRYYLTTLVTHDLLEPRLRAEAGTVLSVLGDERDFDEMVTVPEGRFHMGNSSAHHVSFVELGVPSLVRVGIAEEDAHSFLASAWVQHEVALDSFQISRYPITNGQYARFVAATGCPRPEHWRGATPPPGLHNHPVVFVSWYDARAYCAWRSAVEGKSFRLPTEAEWEKAAIGTQGTLFPWGDELTAVCHNNYQAGIGTTSSVGIFAAGMSPYGCFDMAGNVYEWTSSLWGTETWRTSFGYPYVAGDGREALDAPDTVYRVLRGGAYYLSNIFASCTYRDRDLPTNKGRSLGFRVVTTDLL
ncbi:MAG TPA: SUMF1/EgtB/PvdO family nonheme iron enzyme [Caldilineaceae bacterium]|nr:SUMF1/EgtB/PvdO family nonheme iron enzyme [Caldilineaceae bacterium]